MMTEKNKTMEVQKQEEIQTDGTERMRDRATFIPRRISLKPKRLSLSHWICPALAKRKLILLWKRAS